MRLSRQRGDNAPPAADPGCNCQNEIEKRARVAYDGTRAMTAHGQRKSDHLLASGSDVLWFVWRECSNAPFWCGPKQQSWGAWGPKRHPRITPFRCTVEMDEKPDGKSNSCANINPGASSILMFDVLPLVLLYRSYRFHFSCG